MCFILIELRSYISKKYYTVGELKYILYSITVEVPDITLDHITLDQRLRDVQPIRVVTERHHVGSTVTSSHPG